MPYSVLIRQTERYNVFTDKPDWEPAVYDSGSYYGFPNKPAEFYLDNNLLPVTPHTWEISNENCNESTQTTQGHPLTIPKLDKAQKFKMEFIFLHDQRFQRNLYSTLVEQKSENTVGGTAVTWFEVKDLTDFLWQKKADRDPFVLTIIYPNQENLNLKAILDDYTYTQDATDASDYKFSLSFTEYHEALNQEVDVELKNTLIKHNIRALRDVQDNTTFNPETYETETGKHSPTWEEIKSDMENWLSTEYKKTHDNKDYTSFDQAFKEFWESDESRKDLHMPDTPKELGYWWNDFMEKSKTEQAVNTAMPEIEAWLNEEIKKVTDNPPTDFWEKFKLWWRSDPTRENNLHRPTSNEELTNWWNDYKALGKIEEDNKKALSDCDAWLNAELKRLGIAPGANMFESLKKWWDTDADRKEHMHCPDNNDELINWWKDFMKNTEADKSLLPDIKAWLNVEIKKITDKPPSDFKEKFKLWWNSDESRKSLHMPDTDAELVNWWKDFMAKSEQEQKDKKKWADIDAWLTVEIDRIGGILDQPDDFWARFKIWWDHEDRGDLHMPDNQAELFAWWDDFMAKSKGES